MKLGQDTLNALVNDLAVRLDGGVLAFYDGPVPATPRTPLAPFREPLVELRLLTPAFEPATAGRAQALPPPAVKIARSGTPTWARLDTSAGTPVAILQVAETGSADALDADILADRLDFSRDGLCTIRSWYLRLPAQPA